MRKTPFSLLILALILPALSISGCNRNQKPDNLIPENKYIDITVEFGLLKAYQTQFKDSTKTLQLKNEIYKHYNITQEQFSRSRNYYLETKKLHSLMKRALDTLNVERNRIWEGNTLKDSSNSALHIKAKKPAKADTQSSRKK